MVNARVWDVSRVQPTEDLSVCKWWQFLIPDWMYQSMQFTHWFIQVVSTIIFIIQDNIALISTVRQENKWNYVSVKCTVSYKMVNCNLFYWSYDSLDLTCVFWLKGSKYFTFSNKIKSTVKLCNANELDAVKSNQRQS